MDNILGKEELFRYSRSLLLPYFSEDKQRRLLGSRVLVVGAGALGSIVSMYLAGSGIGHIAMADFDSVDLSNLQRQLSFSTADVGRNKALATADRIRGINPDVSVTAITELITDTKLRQMSDNFDLIVEGSDNPATKYMVSEFCKSAGIPCVLGGVSADRGQVMSYRPGCMSYTDWFPEQGCGTDFLPCSTGGILGPVPGIIGSVMATEVIKILADVGTPLYNRLFIVDALDMTSTVIGS